MTEPVPYPVTAAAGAALLAALSLPAGVPGQEADSWERDRERMVREGVAAPGAGIEAVTDGRVLRAMRSVPRHEFVPEELRELAYVNRPLPIGHGQTISQPYVVARMTELLELEPGDSVLEVGTGSGYQAAVLAEITDRVFSVEIVRDLARTARQRLRRLGYEEVAVRHGDGYEGWSEHAPFHAIIVTAAPERVPDALVRQLARGGRMVIPVGPRGETQVLTVVRRTADGSVEREEVSFVRFVPMVREEG